MSFINHTYINPSAKTASNITQAVELNNKANTLTLSGDLAGAEKAHLEALNLKIEATGPKSIQTALSKNALGEVYLKMGKVDEAQRFLEESYAVRKIDPNFDTAVTRENLGQLWEMKGDLLKAREIRNAGGPDSMACGNPNCPGQMFKQNQLKHCARCQSVWYDNQACQRMDWGRHKKYCKPMEN